MTKQNEMSKGDAKTTNQVKEVYQALKEDEVFKVFADARLMEYALEIVSITTTRNGLTGIEESFHYIS